MTCVTNLNHPYGFKSATMVARRAQPTFAYTDITYLLHKYHVSWHYYVRTGQAAGLRRPGRRHLQSASAVMQESQYLEPAA